MKQRLLLTLGLIVLVMGAFSASPAGAQTTANGPYYATPSWDQSLACTTLANCPRFIVLSNMGSAAVLDRETGLVWEKSPTTNPATWAEAQLHCIDLAVGNRKGWRLPTIQELASLVDPNNPGGNPDLPPGHPFINVEVCRTCNYWSGTTYAILPSDAWVLHFGSGGVGHFDKTLNFNFSVWCVRGGQGEDSQ